MQDSYTYFSQLGRTVFQPGGCGFGRHWSHHSPVFLAAVLFCIFSVLKSVLHCQAAGDFNPGLAWVAGRFCVDFCSVSGSISVCGPWESMQQTEDSPGPGSGLLSLKRRRFVFFVQLWRRSDAFQGSGTFLRQVLGRAAGGTLAGLAAAALAVFQYISLYDVFQSCNPGTSVVFLVLSVIFPIFGAVFPLCRPEKRLGDAQAGRSCLGAGAACGGRSAYRPPASCRPGSPGRFLKAGAVE